MASIRIAEQADASAEQAGEVALYVLDDGSTRIKNESGDENIVGQMVLPVVASGKVMTIPAGYQWIVSDELEVVGELVAVGELVIV